MPTYVYECSKCNEEIEVWRSFSDEPLKKHPGCGGKLTKVYQPVGIVLKGPGFYKTDSRNGKKSASASTSERSESSSADSGSGSKSESKSDSAKPETKKADTKKADKAKPSSSSSKSS